MDVETQRILWRMSQDERHKAIRESAVKAVGNSRTNPTPQAQYLATDAATEGFEAGVRAAIDVFCLMRMMTDSVQELSPQYLAELERYFESEPQ